MSSMGRVDKRSFRRSVDALGDIFDFADEFVAREELDAKAEFAIKFVVEELFTNMVKYNVDGSNDIEISIHHLPSQLTLQMIDFDVDSFDPKSLEEVDISLPIEDRVPGGLGLHLVKSMVDDIKFDYTDRNMKITVIKNLEQ